MFQIGIVKPCISRMAAPGLGIGDLVKACDIIVTFCKRYKEAPQEFDEIAEKATSTAIALERIDDEAKLSGNLVERAGPTAYRPNEHFFGNTYTLMPIQV